MNQQEMIAVRIEFVDFGSDNIHKRCLIPASLGLAAFFDQYVLPPGKSLNTTDVFSKYTGETGESFTLSVPETWVDAKSVALKTGLPLELKVRVCGGGCNQTLMGITLVTYFVLTLALYFSFAKTLLALIIVVCSTHLFGLGSVKKDEKNPYRVRLEKEAKKNASQATGTTAESTEQPTEQQQPSEEQISHIEEPKKPEDDCDEATLFPHQTKLLAKLGFDNHEINLMLLKKHDGDEIAVLQSLVSSTTSN